MKAQARTARGGGKQETDKDISASIGDTASSVEANGVTVSPWRIVLTLGVFAGIYAGIYMGPS